MLFQVGVFFGAGEGYSRIAIIDYIRQVLWSLLAARGTRKKKLA